MNVFYAIDNDNCTFIEETSEINVVHPYTKEGVFGYSIRNNNIKMCNVILNNCNFNVDFIDISGATSLMYAVSFYNNDLFKRIITEFTPDVTLQNQKGENILLMSYRYHNIDAFKYLIHTFPNTRELYRSTDLFKCSILHYMAQQNDYKNLKCIKLKYLDDFIFKQNTYEQTPIDIILNLYTDKAEDFLNILLKNKIINEVLDNNLTFIEWIYSLPCRINTNLHSNLTPLLVNCCIEENIDMIILLLLNERKNENIDIKTIINIIINKKKYSEYIYNLFINLLLTECYDKCLIELFNIGVENPLQAIDTYELLLEKNNINNVIIHNEVYGVDGMCSNPIEPTMCRNFKIGDIIYTYDILFLLTHWLYQKQNSYFVCQEEIVYTFPLHKNIFFFQSSINLLLCSTNKNWNCEFIEKTNIRPCSGGANTIFDHPVYKFT